MLPRIPTPAIRVAQLRPFSARAVHQPWRARTQPSIRLYSSTSEDAPPPLLQKLKGDLKTAMRAKDAPRLSVLRTIMSANLNASKTSSPIRTDVQLVGLIRKLQKASHDSVADAEAAGRNDLVEKEQQQIKIYDEYLADSGVQALSVDELSALIQSTIEEVQAAGTEIKNLGQETMKRIVAAVKGKDVDMKTVSKMVQEAVKKQ
ncbi:hypothetical protein S7711_00415 [Stachybotrys chartarum IBT 7711]|uniref:Altered inheritance of mitochondria protein 41 n=1 Tax=Stachybotrys chartarum (strain CBS 109288 / IBT 7711) TaxID=1280523 RepID=A0A084B9M9_STACB|nr:hypothetical protein S7711_00415 [Stachybotrys chartarum IBT 7711]KFA49067.1 hypothetical protein S40293_07949 [Stachybotrys chartarum IBT 40293]